MRRLQPTVSNPGTAGAESGRSNVIVWYMENTWVYIPYVPDGSKCKDKSSVRMLCQGLHGRREECIFKYFLYGEPAAMSCGVPSSQAKATDRSGRLFASSVQAVSRSMRWLSCSTGNIPNTGLNTPCPMAGVLALLLPIRAAALG